MATYFVGKNGNDSNNGSQLSPWATLSYAAQAVSTPGSQILVRGGTYFQQAVLGYNHSGIAGAPIQFLRYPGEQVVIDGSLLNATSQTGIVLVGGAYIDVDGFEICNNPADFFNGIYTNGQHLNFRNLKIHHVGHSGIKDYASDLVIATSELYECCIALDDETISAIGVNNLEIKGCHIHDTNKHGIDCKDGCTNVLIHDNDISAIRNDEPAIYLDCGNSPMTGIKIYRNRLHDTYWGITTGSEISPQQLTADIYNNLLYKLNIAIGAWPYLNPKTLRIINNTFYLNDTAIQISDAAIYQIACAIRNNIFVSATVNSLIDCFYPGGITIDHNLFWQPLGLKTVTGTDYINADPLLVDPANGDFHLQAGSPAIDAGSPTDAPTDDFEGKPRPYGVGFDIGAYEYVAASGFQHGTLHTASFQITENPYGKSCQFEFWLGPNQTTKIATAGKVNFTSGANVPVTCSITMPAAGTYNVYVDVYMLGVFIERFTSSTVTVV